MSQCFIKNESTTSKTVHIFNHYKTEYEYPLCRDDRIIDYTQEDKLTGGLCSKNDSLQLIDKALSFKLKGHIICKECFGQLIDKNIEEELQPILLN